MNITRYDPAISEKHEAVAPFLSPAERERLAKLVEELGEALAVCGKILRHGFESHDPTVPPSQRETNREWLERELGDVRHAMILMCESHDLRQHAIHTHAHTAFHKVIPWMHHQKPRLVYPVLQEEVKPHD